MTCAVMCAVSLHGLKEHLVGGGAALSAQVLRSDCLGPNPTPNTYLLDNLRQGAQLLCTLFPSQ